jgi:hypothetical protein
VPLVRIDGKSFPAAYAHLNRSWDERWRLSSVVLASFVAGRRPKDRFEAGLFSVADMLESVWLTRANLRVANNRFVRSPVYLRANGARKRVVSYSVGQTFAHLFMTRFLSIQYTMDVDRYAAELGVIGVRGSRLTPDLIGNGRGWVVAEAKGRSWWLDTKTRQHAAQQKRAIASIGGTPPSLCVVSVAHFGRSVLSLEVSDPDTVGPLSLPGDRLDFLRAFYRPLVHGLQSGTPRSVFGREVLFLDVPELDLAVGLEAGIAESASSNSGLLSLAEQSVEDRAVRDSANSNTAIEANGVAVQLGPTWRVAMKLEQALDRPAREDKRNYRDTHDAD